MTWQPVPPQPPNRGWDPPPGNASYGRPPGGPPVGPPPHQPGPPTSSGDDQRSVIILVLSLASFMVFFVGCSACGPLALLSLGLSIPAIVMARRDLALMDSGHMSPKGRDATKIGFVIAIVSTVISVLTGLAMIAVVAIYGGFFGMLALNESGAFQ